MYNKLSEYYWEIIKEVVEDRVDKEKSKENDINDGILTMKVMQLHMSQAVPSVWCPWQMKIHFGLLLQPLPESLYQVVLK